MISVIYGRKGMGKTKILIDAANKSVDDYRGEVVFIDDSNQLMYDLKHEIRFINVRDFPVSCQNSFTGFVCGIIAENYDINSIFIDGLTYILKEDIKTMEPLFQNLDELSTRFNIDFNISINGDPETMPVYLVKYRPDLN